MFNVLNRSPLLQSLCEANEGDRCGHTLNEVTSLPVHERHPTGIKPYKCTNCGKLFLEYSFLQNQKRCQSGYTTHAHEECGQAGRCASCLSSHVGINLVEKPCKSG